MRNDSVLKSEFNFVSSMCDHSEIIDFISKLFMFKKPMSKFPAHSALRLKNSSISLLLDSLLGPDEVSVYEN